MLSLVPGVAISASSSVAPETNFSASRPYLAAVGPAVLRFGDPPPPPDLRPAAGAPPVPAEETPAPVVDAATAPDASLAEVAEPIPAASVAAPVAKPAATRTSPPILPDDTRTKVRAEDFLPFFQFPATGPNGDVNVVVPVAPGANSAAPIPPSSATYRQQ